MDVRVSQEGVMKTVGPSEYSQHWEEEQRQGIDQTIPPGRREEVKVEDYECYDIGADRGYQEASGELALGLPGG